MDGEKSREQSSVDSNVNIVFFIAIATHLHLLACARVCVWCRSIGETSAPVGCELILTHVHSLSRVMTNVDVFQRSQLASHSISFVYILFAFDLGALLCDAGAANAIYYVQTLVARKLE